MGHLLGSLMGESGGLAVTPTRCCDCEKQVSKNDLADVNFDLTLGAFVELAAGEGASVAQSATDPTTLVTKLFEAGCGLFCVMSKNGINKRCEKGQQRVLKISRGQAGILASRTFRSP